MKKCGYCGADVADEEKVCPGCGRTMDSDLVGNPFEESVKDGGIDEVFDAAKKDAQVNDMASGSASNENRGEGYWQYGQWHSIDELNNQASYQDPATQNPQNGWNPNAQNPWGQNPGGQQGWNPQAPYGNQGYGPNAPYNMNQGNMNGYNPNFYGQAPYMQPQKAQMCGEAIASLVFSIVSVFLNSFLMIPSILAVVFGIVALVKIRKSQGRLGGKGLAIAGIIVGVIFFLLFLFAYILLFRMMNDPALWKAFEEYVKQLEQL